MNIFAYLDPGTGSLILQALVGIGAGVAFFVANYWHRIRSFFSRKNKDGNLNEKE